MSSTTAPLATTRRPMTWPVVVLVVLAVGQLVSSGLSSLANSPLTQADRPDEPPLTPAGYTFAIWGLIELVSLALAVWLAWFRRRAADEALPVVDALARALVVLFTGFSLWLTASILEPVWATLVVFVVMGVALFLALRTVVGHRAEIATWPPVGRLLVWTTLGLYAGWCTVAIWLNLLTALGFSGVPLRGTVGLVGQLAILAGATGTAFVVLRWTRGLLPYAAAVVWALVGAIVGASGAGEPALAGAAGVGLVVVAVTTLVLRVRRPPRRALA